MLLEGKVALITGSAWGTGAGIARVFAREGVPLRRIGKVEDTTHVALFFASELGSYVTGSYVPVSGGQVML